MPTNTPNLNLIKPLVSEHYDVVVANANNDILDSAVGDVYTKSEVDGLVGGLAPQATTYTKTEVDAQVGLLAPTADPTFTGTQTLPNIVTNGIKFPATQVPSADPNTLDDYEEGTFTPIIIGGTTQGTGNVYSVQTGYYTKIGNLVTLFGRVRLSTKGTGTGSILVGGLPFAAKIITGRIKCLIPYLDNITGITIDDVNGTFLSNLSGQAVINLADSLGNFIDFSKVTANTTIDYYANYMTD